ncbi:Sensory neuron membrane protein 1 [Orchesella cincta]|uniref:Sensory neuron membrane protein 1 n=1 Tax=Orchesella cincta TaxID=48709 RepID=A0A1D2N229_ORCCI|nr:Sensory neuron membrane protein 1 [Orchesella cincta]
MTKKFTRGRLCALGTSGAGLVVLVIAVVVGWVVVPNVIDGKVKDETQLVESSDVWEKWKDIPVPIYLKVWFFNVTNAHEFGTTTTSDWSAVPQFKEVGPYVFKETRVKYDIREGPLDTLYFRQNISYVFDAAMSGEGLHENDIVTTVNLPFVAAITLLQINKPLHMLGNALLTSLLSSNESIFASAAVNKVLFKGVDLKPIYKTVELAARALSIPLPDEIFNGTFAYYRGKNDSNGEGEWRVYRGVEDSTMFNTIKSVNDGKTRLEPWWKDHCAMVNGTDGTMFPPFITKDTRLYIYVPEICRSIFIEYDSETEYEGIKGYRFKLPPEMFTDPYVYTANMCFCMDVKGEFNNSCNFNGMGRLFSCKANVPVTIGKPHFLDADEWVVEEARKFGMSPRRNDHDTFLDLEPNTGFPLRAHKRLQIGAEIQPLNETVTLLTPLRTIPHIIYPVFWADEQAVLDEPLIDEIKQKLTTPLKIVMISKWTAVAIGIALASGGAALFTYSWFH